MTPTNEQITAAARALSDDNADVCNVNREDNWNFYGDSFRETARVALEAAMAAPAVDAQARDEREAFDAWFKREYGRIPDPLRFADCGKWLAWQARAALSAESEAAAGEPVAWRTTEPTVCVPMTEDSSVSAMWRDAGYDVIDLFEHRPSDDALWGQTLQERDSYHDWADKLANAIGLHLDVDIGEHSSANLPWNNALDAIMAAPPAASAPKLTLSPKARDALDSACSFFEIHGFDDYVSELRALLRASSATASDSQGAEDAV